MKTLAIALGLTGLLATSATSADFPIAGQAVELGAESDTNYTTGIEDWDWELTPYAAITMNNLRLGVETDIDMLKLDEDKVFQGVDLTADYPLSTSVNLYGEVSSDDSFTFGDVKLGATVKF